MVDFLGPWKQFAQMFNKPFPEFLARTQGFANPSTYVG